MAINPKVSAIRLTAHAMLTASILALAETMHTLTRARLMPTAENALPVAVVGMMAQDAITNDKK